jgi:ABC-type multidrug transport system fused ATPase/permease subunit
METTESKSENPTKPTRKKFNLGTLYRYSTRGERWLLLLGSVCAFAEGAAMPAFSYVFGSVLDTVGNNGPDVMESMEKLALAMLLIAVGIFFLASAWSGLFSWTAVRQTNRLRRAYLAAVLSKDISWFDLHSPGEIPSRLADDMDKYQNAISQKAGMALMNISQAMSGMLLGFIAGWQLALVVLGGIPLIGIAMVMLTRAMGKSATEGQASYAKAGSIAEEVLMSIRTVTSFGGQGYEINRYTGNLEGARRSGTKIGTQVGISLGLVMLVTFWSYALTFWFGSWLVQNNITNTFTGKTWTIAEVIVVFFSVLMGTFGLGQIGPSISAFTEGTAVLRTIYEVIESSSDIEPSMLRKRENDNALVAIKHWKMNNPPSPPAVLSLSSIHLSSVRFHYPARPEVPVLRSVSLTIRAGQKVALVGESGSGKSTIISLIERFYDPIEGRVLINELVDIKTIPPRELRAMFGYVGQEPVMFATSVRGNLTYGFSASEMPSEAEIIDSLKMANVYSFVRSLPEGLDTYCGSGGSQMSGGQKQRLAIARALLRNPQVLLLDEATSALDNESEKMVQQTIDSLNTISRNLTTISVAHRLSTIRNSDVIFVLQRGELIQQGTHDELMANHAGLYKSLVSAQVGDAGDTLTAESTITLPRQLTDEPTSAPVIPSPPEKLEEQIDKERQDAIAKSYSVPYGRLLAFTKPERWLYFPAIFGAAVKGVAFPIHALIFSAVIGWFYTAPDLSAKIRQGCLEYVGLGIAVFFGIVLDIGIFAYISEWFTLRVRATCFTHMLSQDMSFFDKPENSPAKLQLALSTLASRMNAITTNVIGIVFEVAAAIIAGMVIAFIASPKLAAVLTASLPIVVGTSAVATKVMLGATQEDKNLSRQAAQVASEAVQNMRTVRSLNGEREVIASYEKLSSRKIEIDQRKSWSNGLIFGFSMCSLFLPYALGYWYGGKLVANDELDIQAMTQALIGLLLGAMGAGQALSFMADVAAAKTAAHDVFELLDTESKISPFDESNDGEKVAVDLTGPIEFSDVYFSYPQRPDVPILRGLTFSVQPGQKVALVGPSGNGKSTVMALLQRFYDPASGAITIGGRNIQEFSVPALRACMGYVGQEPVLFDATMRDNVLYGNRGAGDEDLERVQKLAKLDFVNEESVQWDTVLGPKGGLLSGGQKQRTAIARALIRDPKILLLDEATSALDSASEKVVQTAIDAATAGRTTFVIAHRLSTIEDADIILVILEGRVVESGTHVELMSKQGPYYQLYKKGQK